MSGVKVGTRLEQLETLRSRLDHEIAIERHKAATRPTPPPATRPTPPPAPSRPDVVTVELTKATTTTAAIRAWAIAQGLMAPTQRHGRIGLEIIDLYREATS